MRSYKPSRRNALGPPRNRLRCEAGSQRQDLENRAMTPVLRRTGMTPRRYTILKDVAGLWHGVKKCGMGLKNVRGHIVVVLETDTVLSFSSWVQALNPSFYLWGNTVGQTSTFPLFAALLGSHVESLAPPLRSAPEDNLLRRVHLEAI